METREEIKKVYNILGLPSDEEECQQSDQLALHIKNPQLIEPQWFINTDSSVLGSIGNA
ncbi:MAG: hypothetical protein JW828_00965 [Sedimentisphaerales bacterium]|nr:hypothetical protein [Sedimentisphaerales bacterium]